MKSFEFDTVIDVLADLRRMAGVGPSTLLGESRNRSEIENQFYSMMPETNITLTEGNSYWPITMWIVEDKRAIYLATVIDYVKFVGYSDGYNYFKYENGTATKFPTEDTMLNEACYYYEYKEQTEKLISMVNLYFDLSVWTIDARAYDSDTGQLRKVIFK